MMNRSYAFLDELVEHDEFLPSIFDAQTLDGSVPNGFNSVRLYLNGKVDSDLEWSNERHAAVRYVGNGFKILWELDLGIFSSLKQPLTDQVQFHAIQLALEHFVNTLWTEFHKHTLGVCLYRGTLNFQEELRQDQEIAATLMEMGAPSAELYYRDVALEYLIMLTDKLPEKLTPVVLLDTSHIEDSLLKTQLLNREKFGRLVVGATEPPSLYGSLSTTQIHCLNQTDKSKIGVCLPPEEYNCPESQLLLRELIASLDACGRKFRLIPEEQLTSEWEQLDQLIIIPNAITPGGMRKLRGFCAAGGTLLYIGEYHPKLDAFQQVHPFPRT